MPDLQEFIALGIVGLVAVGLLWRRRLRQAARILSGSQTAGKTGSCEDCPTATPPPKERRINFYRRG